MFTDEERIAHLEEDCEAYRKALVHVTGIDPVMFQPPPPGGTPTIVRAFRAAKQTAEQTLIKADIAHSERVAVKLEEN